jgi:hypothetical protein
VLSSQLPEQTSFSDQVYINDFKVPLDNRWHHQVVKSELVTVRHNNEQRPIQMNGISKAEHTLQFKDGVLKVIL